MSKKPTWKEALKEYHSIKKAEFEKMNEELSQNLNYKRERDNFKPEGYRFYNPNNFTTKPQEIYKNLDERERLKEIDHRRKNWAMDKKKEEYKVLSLDATFTVGHATESWKSPDDKTVKKEARKRTENGKNIDMAIKTLRNFNIEDMKSKIEVIQRFNSVTYVLEAFNDLKNGVITERNKRFEKFLERYEILEEPHIDLETGMSALVIGHRENKTVEIIFGASQDPSNIFRKNEPRKLENFKGSEKLKRYIERGENAKYATMDWAGNNLKSPAVTPPNQKAALKFAEEIQEKYKNGHNGYITLTDTNGHSKGGGESIYTASNLDLRCFTIDSAPVINLGKYINNNKFLTIVPNMGNGTLTATERIEGTEFHIAKFKIGTNGKGENKFSNTLAIPVEYDHERAQRIKEIFKGNKTTMIFLDSFKQHYPDNELAIERTEELQKYAEKIAPEFYEKYKDGRYIDRKESENVFVR